MTKRSWPWALVCCFCWLWSAPVAPLPMRCFVLPDFCMVKQHIPFTVFTDRLSDFLERKGSQPSRGHKQKFRLGSQVKSSHNQQRAEQVQKHSYKHSIVFMRIRGKKITSIFWLIGWFIHSLRPPLSRASKGPWTHKNSILHNSSTCPFFFLFISIFFTLFPCASTCQSGRITFHAWNSALKQVSCGHCV